MKSTLCMDTKISIIVPVFNTAEYIEQCINSLTSQTFQDIEILIVDDGSTDNSWEKLEGMSLEFPQIRLFRKSNGGQGSARNLALDNAQGNYVLFVDSDDWVEPNTCEILTKSLVSDEVDILCFNYNLAYHYRVVPKRIISEPGIWNNGGGLDALFNDKMTGHACNKLYKRSLIESNHIRFSEDKVLFEDLLFTIKVFSYASKVQFAPISPYFYRIRPDSSTQSIDSRLIDQLVMWNRAAEFMKGYGNYEKYQNQVSRMLSISYMDILTRFLQASPFSKIQYQALLPWRNVVKIDHLSLKYKIVFLASLIDYKIAKWSYNKLIIGLYPKLFLRRQRQMLFV